MSVVNLPVESAIEPEEEARQPEVDEGCHSVTFAENTNRNAQNNSAYKIALSQPPRAITHKQKMLWLQQRRTEGLWVQCDDCDRWRYLPHVLDHHELPAKWYCFMNPDTSLAICSAPEAPICLYDENDLIHAEYAAGSIVLARMPGFPWWPAMVCDCPDTEQYYWLDGFSDIPTHYNVVFFDACDASRTWMTPKQLLPYKNNSKLLKNSLKIKHYKNRLDVAITQANDAQKLPLSARLAKYSFIARFNGNISTPKRIKKKVITKYQNRLKRTFNVEFADELSHDEEPIEKNDFKDKKRRKKNYASALVKTAVEKLNSTSDLNSMAVQIGSDSGALKSITTEGSNNNEQETNTVISDTLVSQSSQSERALYTGLTLEEDSEKSDNFDF